MCTSRSCFLFFLFFFCYCLGDSVLDNGKWDTRNDTISIPANGSLQIYIVYLGGAEDSHPDSLEESHHGLLSLVVGSLEGAKQSVLYNYKHSLNGFAAMLSEEQATTLSKMPEVISVFPSKGVKMQTTRSWDFIQDSIVPNSKQLEQLQGSLAKDTVIGLLDTGVWPESDSFKDNGYPPVPEKWKGGCEWGTNSSSFLCNRKLVGAKFYLKGYERMYGKIEAIDYRSPRDSNGHGTHTASTAAGEYVARANVFGFANGTAKGGAPLARIAIYKVCWEFDCNDADILAAMDQAIKDGVDVLSISLGNPYPRPYLEDPIAVGSLHAIQKGITVVCSAGNGGPSAGTVDNVSPWIITVAANTIDREFPTDVTLGDGTHLKGKSIVPYNLEDKHYPFIYGGQAAINMNYTFAASRCLDDTLDSSKVKGKVVLCEGSVGLEVLKKGGAGILRSDSRPGNDVPVQAYLLPGATLSSIDAPIALQYALSAKNPVVKIPASTTLIHSTAAPMMASFSSRGPNSLTSQILKPDLTAPGVNILAAWTQGNSPTRLKDDTRRVKFNLDSGTSMSCPHVAGIVALVKSAHPNWSPSAIKSALITTATISDNTKEAIKDVYTGLAATPFTMGAGEVNPIAALDPGLVYETTIDDYLLFLCNVGYDSSSISKGNRSTIGNGVDRRFTCPKVKSSPSDLNYPSISIVNPHKHTIISRTVTNVGNEGAIYKVKVEVTKGIAIHIYPQVLEFKKVGESKSFKVTLSLNNISKEESAVFGAIIWFDGRHIVRSPVVVTLQAST